MKLLSLCMIVKDEENVLARCLDSTKGLPDEIVIVDTGSRDLTRQIALSFDAKVIDFPWTNDFAEARNVSIRNAEGEWILILDADEYLDVAAADEIRSLLQRTPASIHGFSLPIYNMLGHTTIESTGLRLFRNTQEICYVNPIHEQVVHKNKHLRYGSLPLCIYHTGYMPEIMEQKKKSERNMAIFDTLTKKKNLSPYDHFTLGNEFSKLKEHSKAYDHYTCAFEKGERSSAWFAHCTLKKMSTEIELKLFNEAYQTLSIARSLWPEATDIFTYEGSLYYSLGFWKQAICSFQQAMSIAQNSVNKKYWIVSPDTGYTTPLLFLIELYQKQMDIHGSIKTMTKYLQIKKYDLTILSRFLHLLSLQESSATIIKFLEKQLYNANNTEDIHALFKASSMANTSEIAAHYYQRLQQKESKVLLPYLLRYALLTHDENAFNQHWADIGDQSDIIARNGVCASLVWHTDRYLNDLPTIDNGVVNALIQKVKVKVELDNGKMFLDVLLDLFMTGHYEEYDQVLQCLPDLFPAVARHMSNQLINLHQYELGFEYYSYLINHDELDAEGYVKLSMLFNSLGDSDQAMELLKSAVSLDPNNLSLSILLLQMFPNDLPAWDTYYENVSKQFRYYDHICRQ